jgi:3-hydroxyisobutyrate dehydrogenase
MSKIAPPTTIAFIGVGMMGAPMAGRLAQAGFKLRVFDATPDTLAGFITKNGGAACSSSADAATGAEVLITMLPHGGIVREAMLGEPNGAAGALRSGAIVIDMSTSSPIDTQTLGPALAARGIALLDAPISGGVKRAVEGKLAIMAGGDPALIERCRPLFEAMGNSLHLIGKSGSGHAMKLLNNFMSAAGLVAMCEALLVGRKFGLDPNLMVDVMNAGTAKNNATEVKGKQFVVSETYAAGFFATLMAKDLRLGAELAEHLKLDVPMMRSERDFWADAAKALPPKADHTAVYRYLEQLQERE